MKAVEKLEGEWFLTFEDEQIQKRASPALPRGNLL